MPRGYPNKKEDESKNDVEAAPASTQPAPAARVLIPEPVMSKLQDVGEREDVDAMEVLRRCVKIGLLIDTVVQDGGSVIVRDKDGIDTKIVLL